MRSQSRLAEGLVLVLGSLSMLGILWAALGSWGDPTELAEAELERSTERAAQLLQLTWERQGRLPGAPTGAVMWSGRAADLEPRTGPKLGLLGTPSGFENALEAQLKQASALGDLEAALACLERFPNARNRADGWLLVVQLAAGAGEQEVVVDALVQAQGEVGPGASKLGVSYLVLLAVAAAPVLDEVELAEQQALLLGHWQSGELRLPEPADPWIESEHRAQFDPRHEAWVRAMVELSPVHAEVMKSLANHGGRAFWSLHQHLGGPELPRELDQWMRLGGGDWLGRRGVDGGLFLARVSQDALLKDVEQRARLGEGFSLVGKGAPSPRRVLIAGESLPILQPRLTDLIDLESSRQASLKVGFGLLLLFVLVATLSTFGALVQRRKLDRLKSHFIAGVSHDLRTPLASILLMAENLESGRVHDAARLKQYHASIRREATRLGRLVDDVLDFSRLERGELPKLALEEVELGDFAELLRTECEERVQQVGGSLVFDTGDLPSTSTLDTGALRRAVINLLDNALTHSGSKSVEVAIRASEDELQVEIADHGTGIPVAEQEGLFEAFAQGSNREHSAGGTGLGLAIVRELARAHGGDARFVNAGEEEHGTRVRISLPRTPDRIDT